MIRTLPVLVLVSASAAAGSTSRVRLDGLGLTIELRGRTSVEHLEVKGLGGEAYILTRGTDRIVVGDTREVDADERHDYVASLPTASDITFGRLVDGYSLVFRQRGLGLDYFQAELERDFAGRRIRCAGSASTRARAERVLATCRTLRPIRR